MKVWAQRQLRSSTITTGGVALTAASIGGNIAIVDAIVKTDASTGLAGGTNFQIQTNNAKGAAVFFAETVANLGAAKMQDMTGASVTKIRTVLESGKAVSLSCTGSNCTGAGTIDVHLRCIRLTAGADLSLV